MATVLAVVMIPLLVGLGVIAVLAPAHASFAIAFATVACFVLGSGALYVALRFARRLEPTP